MPFIHIQFIIKHSFVSKDSKTIRKKRFSRLLTVNYYANHKFVHYNGSRDVLFNTREGAFYHI